MKQKVIGITGNIGSGKTFVLKLCRLLGFKTISMDHLTRVLMTQQEMVTQIAARFPALDTLQDYPGGPLNRQILAHHVFQDVSALKQLESLLHPCLKESLLRAIQEEEQKGSRVIIVEVPLLFEADWTALFQEIILCDALKRERKKRALRRPGMTPALFDKIDALQFPHRFKKGKVDHIINTNHTKQGVLQQLVEIIKKCSGIQSV